MAKKIHQIGKKEKLWKLAQFVLTPKQWRGVQKNYPEG